MSGKLSSGTLPPRSDAPSENYTAPLPGSQSAGSGHSASVCRLSLPHLLQWCRVTGARCPRGASVSSSHQRQSLRGRELKRESVCRDTQLAAAKQCSIKKNNFSPVLNINRYIYSETCSLKNIIPLSYCPSSNHILEVRTKTTGKEKNKHRGASYFHKESTTAEL